jgi:glycosyltransferase involved in cell wall biosynthesis
MGAIPPPYMGPTIATKLILNSKIKNEFDLIHLDTSDHRSLNTLNKADLWNFLLAIKHYSILVVSILKYWPALIYIPNCQTTFGYFRDALFIVICKIFNRKILCHLRGGNFKNWYSSSSALTRWVVRRVHSLIDGQIVLGERLKSLFNEIIPKDKIFVVPNGASISIHEFNEKPSLSNQKTNILFLSNLRREKGIFDVLAAIPEVYSFSHNFQFIFAGEWRNKETKTEYDSFIKMNLNLPVQILSNVYGRSKFELLFSADIFVFPPREPEGHPWVIVEAMAAGLPIITTDEGAITESVKDGVNGFIVEKRNPQQIAEKIKFLIEHPDTRRKMGEESRRLYLENFTEEKMIECLSEAFRAVLTH